MTQSPLAIYQAALAEGASDDVAWERTEAALDARRAARTTGPTRPLASPRASAGPPAAAPVNLPETELAIRAMERQGTPRAEAERVVYNNPGIDWAMQKAISAERELAQQAADKTAADTWAKTPDGIRAAATAALAAKEAKAADAALARAYIEQQSEAAGIPFDASALSDDEALHQSGLVQPTLDPKAAQVREANERYEADPVGEFTRSTIDELRSNWQFLSPAQRTAEIDSLATIGIDASSVATEMKAGSGEGA